MFYEEAFLRAFPVVLRELEPSPYFSAEKMFRSCYTHRAMVRFASFFGLVKIDRVGTEYPREVRITKLPLLDIAIGFRFAHHHTVQ